MKVRVCFGLLCIELRFAVPGLPTSRHLQAVGKYLCDIFEADFSDKNNYGFLLL
jgi:hypothetical protein